LYPNQSYGYSAAQVFAAADIVHAAARQKQTKREGTMRRFLLIAGLLALAVGLLWIGQGTGTVPWPRSSFMVNQLQWAGYGAVMAGFGLVLIWQSNQ
jgi:hypothetical protein